VHRRLQQVNKLLQAYSSGKFDRQLDASTGNEIIDACIIGINMLGEELQATTISRNYFNNIFHAVSDMIFVLYKKGIIKDINQSVTTHLHYHKSEIVNKPIHFLFNTDDRRLFALILQQLKNNVANVAMETSWKTVYGTELPVRINAEWLKTSANNRNGLLLTVKDITSSINTKNLVIRAMVETQEKERKRLARDLHDSFGQQLSAIKFYISALAAAIKDNGHKEILLKSNEALTNMHADMRSICFNLTPKTLEEFGLLKAVYELCSQMEINESIRFQVKCKTSVPHLSKAIETDIFRVVQEFINNSLRHGKASKIVIYFEPTESTLAVKLRDNGIGFNIDDMGYIGLGLQIVQSRIKSHGGKIKIISQPGKGTLYHFFVPINA